MHFNSSSPTPFINRPDSSWNLHQIRYYFAMKSRLIKRLFALGVCAVVSPFGFAQGGSIGTKNPFSAPDATLHYAPDRMYDLKNLVLDLNVDYPDRLLVATATNRLSALRDGVTQLRFNAGAATKIEWVKLDGRAAAFTRDPEGIMVSCPPTKAGETHEVEIHYHLKKADKGEGGGWHWHEPKANDPSKVGLWTNGETDDTRDWAVTWDYPNDFTTSETRTTVPLDWQVVGNGVQISDKTNAGGKTHTVTWRMTQPHATYLTSIVAGPFDIVKDSWRGVPLFYVAPKGKGALLAYSFGHTKDMLSFYSDSLGVKYPWPKYAEDATYGFGGGQENVSATTLGAEFLTDPRDGYYTMDSLNSHELGHQWFGDDVTCKDWGQIWLNESFAEFMMMSYTLHSLGINGSQREVESESQDYLDESRRYERPMVTNFYKDPGVMFDQHTYPKGAVLLFSLRKQLGQTLFYAGLKHYLELHHNSPVETNDLCEAMTDATGINLHPWFDQWIYKPGHPVIDWSWSWDETKKLVDVRVRQTQSTANGTPIYDLPAKVGFISPTGRIDRASIHLSSADQHFFLTADQKPGAVVFDPDHDFLRQIDHQPWANSELPIIAMYAPDCVQRQAAFNAMLEGTPSDSLTSFATFILFKDRSPNPAILDTSRLIALKRESLRSFWGSEVSHPNFVRRTNAVKALAELQPTSDGTAMLRNLIDDRQPYSVVVEAIPAVAKWDYMESRSRILGQANSPKISVRVAALTAIFEHEPKLGAQMVFESLAPTQPDAAHAAGAQLLIRIKGPDPRIEAFARRELRPGDRTETFIALQLIQQRKMSSLIPDLEALEMKDPRFSRFIDPIIKQIQSPSVSGEKATAP
jgi:aminopeptidase N